MADAFPPHKRSFPRHSLQGDLDLTVAGSTIHGTLINLSPAGLGVIIRDVSALESPLIDLKIKDMDVSIQGKVVWTRNVPDGMIAGLQTEGPIRGNLRYYGLPGILKGLQSEGKTGILEIDSGIARNRIYFVRGDVVLFLFDHDHDRLGDVLLDIGKITAEQHLRALDITKTTGRPQGAVLVELGHITPADFIRTVRSHFEKIMADLFMRDYGDFVFREEPVPVKGVIASRFNIGDLIYHGTKKMGKAERIRDLCPSPLSVPELTGDAAGLLQKITIDKGDEGILSLIDGKRTVKDIVALAFPDEMETMKTICAFSNAGVINVISGTSGPADEETVFAIEDETGEDAESLKKVDKMYMKYKELGYYGILGVGNNASPAEIRQAYHKVAKEFHPDRYLHFRSDVLREKLNDIFVYINEAYSQLSKAAEGGYRTVAVESKKEPLLREDNRTIARQRFNEGREWFGSGHYEQAVTLFGQAIYLEKSVAAYHFYYGMALLKSKKFKSAEESIRAALKLDPSNSEYLTELGYIYLQLGFRTRAKNSFSNALSYNSSNRRAAEGLNQVQD